jgi:hypothetical protein
VLWLAKLGGNRGELLDPIGVPGIWFPFHIGVSQTQYVCAIAVPLLAILIVRTLSARGIGQVDPVVTLQAH